MNKYLVLVILDGEYKVAQLLKASHPLLSTYVRLGRFFETTSLAYLKSGVRQSRFISHEDFEVFCKIPDKRKDLRSELDCLKLAVANGSIRPVTLLSMIRDDQGANLTDYSSEIVKFNNYSFIYLVDLDNDFLEIYLKGKQVLSQQDRFHNLESIDQLLDNGKVETQIHPPKLIKRFDLKDFNFEEYKNEIKSDFKLWAMEQ